MLNFLKKIFIGQPVLCPNCNSANIKKVIYGTFRNGALRGLSEEHVSYRGCCVAGHEGGALPEYQCVFCDTEFNEEYVCERVSYNNYRRGKLIKKVDRHVKIYAEPQKLKKDDWSISHYHYSENAPYYADTTCGVFSYFKTKEEAEKALPQFIAEIKSQYPPDTTFEICHARYKPTIKKKLRATLRRIAFLIQSITDIPDFIKSIPDKWRYWHNVECDGSTLMAIALPFLLIIAIPFIIVVIPFILLWDFIKKRLAPVKAVSDEEPNAFLRKKMPTSSQKN